MCKSPNLLARSDMDNLGRSPENEFVFQFHLEEVVPVIVVRRIDTNELAIVGQELFPFFLFPLNVN